MQKILLASDYVIPIGGIEIYLQNIRNILLREGYDVNLFGRDIANISKVHRFAGLFVTYNNVWYAKKIKKCIATFQPDVVWFHSVSRFLWPSVIDALSDYTGEIWMMYHDLWYFHPFAAGVSVKKDIPPFTKTWFVESAGNNWKKTFICNI